MEFVRLKYANNKLIGTSIKEIKEYKEIITDYVDKKGFDYVGFIPMVFGPNGRILEVDLLFRKPAERKTEVEKPKAETK